MRRTHLHNDIHHLWLGTLCLSKRLNVKGTNSESFSIGETDSEQQSNKLHGSGSDKMCVQLPVLSKMWREQELLVPQLVLESMVICFVWQVPLSPIRTLRSRIYVERFIN